MVTKNFTDLLCSGELLWDESLTWTNNSWPQFTDCFQKTVIAWIPCGWLWLSAPFYAYHLLSDKRKVQPIRFLFCLKIFFILVSIGVHIVHAFESFRDRKSIASITSPLIWIATMFLHSYLVYLERTRKKVRSPISFIFWILVTIASSISLHTTLNLQLYLADEATLPLVCIKFAVSVLSVLVHCLPDYVKQKDKEGKNPELFSSLITWIFLFWFEWLVIKGFKSKLSDEDIFKLHPQDRTKRTVKKFLYYWDKEVNKKVRKKAKQKYTLDENWEAEIPLLPLSASHPPAHVQPLNGEFNKTVNDPGEAGLDEVESKMSYIDARKHHSNEEVLPQVSLNKIMVKCYWREAISAQSGMIMHIAFNICSPLVLGWLINFTRNTKEPSWHGYIYAAAFILLRFLYNIFVNMSKWCNNRFASRVQCTGMATIFRKSLTMSSEARTLSTTGEIINLMSVDVGHIEAMLIGSFWSWVSAILLVVGVYLLYTIMGLALLSGLGFMFLLFTMNILSSRKMSSYQEIIMTIKDERLKVMNEILNGMKVIKLHGWEPLFIKMVKDIREKELKIYFKYCLLAGFETFTWHVANVWTLYFMLVTFVMISEQHYVGAATIFLTINYANLVKVAMNMLPFFIGDLVKTLNSTSRLNKFLNSENINTVHLIRNTSDPLAIRVIDADFSWIKSGPCILKSINLEVTPGELIAVVGSVGCGKSSLLAAMLGEMHTLKGYINLNSSVAYVPQQAWIQNNTLKENILFGKQFHREYFQEVVTACDLTPDLNLMPAGADTEIGEKGINLSGGQKQRVSLARAVYSKADIYLLDDPLSAVDSHVGKHIFDHVISKQGLLNDKTRILVTHGIHWLPFVDRIIVISDGQISESGSYEVLLDHNGPFAQYMLQFLTQNVSNVDSPDEDTIGDEVKQDILRRLASVTSESDCSVASERKSKTPGALDINISTSTLFCSNKEINLRSSGRGIDRSKENLHDTISQKNTVVVSETHRLTTDEKIVEGKVKWSLYFKLMQSLGPHHAVLILFLFISYQVVFNFSYFWLADWSDDVRLNNFTDLPANSEERRNRNVYYIGVFTGLTVLMTLFDVTYAVIFQMGHMRAARTFHDNLLSGVMHAPMSFFDTTPIGRILNRFSQDIYSVDSHIFIEIETCLDNLLKCFSTLIVISYTMPVFLSVVAPIIVILYFVLQLYIRSSCQIRRINSNNRSPIYSHFSETLSGVSVIRAYQAQDQFIADSLKKVDTFQQSYLAYKGLNRWLEARLGLVSCVISTAATIFAVVYRNDLSPGLVGLAITYALRVSNDMNVLTITFGNLENHIISLERIMEYTKLQSEAAWEVGSVDDLWPTIGTIEFINYGTRYRSGLSLVLKNLSCVIHGGEKVGIVGRTGAGKSSMMLSLFRLIEAAEGKILIDGVDISSLGLHTLRKKLTILPQDPVLFDGSIRMNLDPFSEKSDLELWKVLENARLKNFIEGLPNTLDYKVGEGGHNLSVGQRQLICLARTLLRKSKIFILDEATAAVDMETDEFIQTCIREEFVGCTVLTIAHRLKTVLDYDRIMVLDDGEVVEFDSPKNLLSRVDSVFYSMASQAGLV
ncbi:multidrug resistance-associated protein 1 [Biomphalaria glabrata]